MEEPMRSRFERRLAVMLPSAFLILAASAGTSSAATVTVNDGSDSTNACATTGVGTCTLRDAITYANAHSGTTIHFNISGAGVHTITPASSYPQIVAPVTIDGYTQPGSSPNSNGPGLGDDSVHLIEIDGVNTSGGLGGACLPFYIGSGPSTVRGLVINRCVGDGIVFISTGGGNTVIGNFIGTDPTGTTALCNANALNFDTVSVIHPEQNDVVGGIDPADRNLLSGCPIAGVNINTGTGYLVQGNFIGTNAAGTAALANHFGISTNSANSTFGGTTPAARNLVSGNSTQQVELSSSLGNPAVTGNVVEGNFIGTDVTGTLPIPAGEFGVADYGFANTIGGSAAGAGNVIAAGLTGGIAGGANGSVIQGNFIGTDPTGTLALGSLGPAIQISSNNVVVGGISAGEGNVIAFNGFPTASGGVVVVSGGTGNTIRGNSIHDNTQTGIDLGDDGVTPNDLCDGDSGANNLQNYPVLVSVTYGANTTVTGLLNAVANTTYQLDFYANPACSNFPRDFLQGETYLGSTQVTTDASCNAPFTISTLPAVAAGSRISVTATDPAGNTSEFSQRLPFSVNVKSGPAAGGTALTISGTNFLAGAGVTIGGVAATGIGVTSYTSMTATTPALAPGTANDLVVTNTDMTTGTLVKGFVADFLDVPSSQQFYAYVTTLVSNGITAGVGGGLYGVNDDTLRQQMAVFILKGKHGLCYTPPPCTGVFADVPCPSTFANWIEAMAAEGITGGCGGGNFCPQNPVRRDQMSVFLLKGEHGSSYVPPMCTGIFTDVPCPSPFANWIEQLFHEGITGGCGGSNYCPSSPNTRGQMAVFLVKTFNLQ
jgi:hypothetical protein